MERTYPTTRARTSFGHVWRVLPFDERPAGHPLPAHVDGSLVRKDGCGGGVGGGVGGVRGPWASAISSPYATGLGGLGGLVGGQHQVLQQQLQGVGSLGEIDRIAEEAGFSLKTRDLQIKIIPLKYQLKHFKFEFRFR